MIGLNTGSTYLQNQIISGFDSVAQGFTATAATSSASGLQAASDSFSSFGTSEMGDLAAMGSQQLISGVAEFSSPATYLNSQLLDSAIQSNDPLLSALQDSHLATGDELSSVSEILSNFVSAAEQQGIIIVSGSPTQLKQSASSKLEQAGVLTPPQIGGSTELEQAGLMTPPQFGGSTKLEQAGVFTPPQYGGFDALKQQTSTKLEQAGVLTPPQIGGSTELEQAGVLTPPQIGGSTKLEQVGLMTPPQFGGSTKLDQVGLMTPPQFGGITFSEQNTATLATMSRTVRDAANLYQATNLSMLSRRIVG